MRKVDLIDTYDGAKNTILHIKKGVNLKARDLIEVDDYAFEIQEIIISDSPDTGYITARVRRAYLPLIISRDKEIRALKDKYKELYGKNAPPYSMDEDAGIEDYKEKLRRLVEHPTLK